MQQKSSTKQSRSSRTRNQRKRELRQVICMSFAIALLWVMVGSMMVKAWVEEEPVNGLAYMETIGGDSYGNPQN